jgi:hypothetical protein
MGLKQLKSHALGVRGVGVAPGDKTLCSAIQDKADRCVSGSEC